MLTDFLFDVPWWLPTAAIGVGAVVFLNGNRRQEKNVMRGGQVLILLGVLIALVSWMVDTDVEKVVKRTKQLAAAVDKRDWQTLASLLDPKTSFLRAYGDREALVKGAEATANAIGLRAVHLLSIEPEEQDTLIVVNVRALSEQDAWGPAVTDWQLQWQDLGDGWKLRTVEPLTNQNVNADEIRQRLVK